MGSTRLIILIVAAVASIGLAFLVINMMGSNKGAPPPAVATGPAGEQPMQRVLVAQRDLKVGEKVTAQALAWQPWPPSAVNATYITDGAAKPMPTGAAAAADKVLEAVTPDSPAMAAVEGAIVREPIFKGEPVVQRKLVKGGEGGFMSVVLQPGMRAMSVPVTVETGAGGFILPNDHVDLLLNEKLQVKSGEQASDVAVSKVLMRNVRVLAIDQTTQADPNARSIVGAVATLEVPDRDVRAVAAAKGQGELMLILRSYNDAAGGPERTYDDGDGAGGTEVVRVFRSNAGSDVRVAR